MNDGLMSYFCLCSKEVACVRKKLPVFEKRLYSKQTNEIEKDFSFIFKNYLVWRLFNVGYFLSFSILKQIIYFKSSMSTFFKLYPFAHSTSPITSTILYSLSFIIGLHASYSLHDISSHFIG